MRDVAMITIGGSSYLKGRIGWQGLRAAEFTDEGPYLITGTDFVNGRVAWDRCYHITEERFAEAPYIHVKNGDLLITKDGTIGKVAHVQNCPERAVLNSGIFLLRCGDGSYHHRYAYYVLTSFIFEEFLRLNLNGSTINHLYQQVFVRFQFPALDSSTQERITTILTAIDRAIEKTEALIEKYQQIKAGLMHDLFTRGVLPNGQLRPPREQAPELYQETAIGWIPKEWTLARAGDLCALITKGTTPPNTEMSESMDGVRFLRVDNLTFDGHIDFSVSSYRVSWQTHTTLLARSRCTPGDVLMNIVGPPLGKVAVVMPSDGEVNINQAIAVFRPKSGLSSRFLLCWLMSDSAKRWIHQRAKQTSGQLNVTLGMCQELALPDISLNEQHLIECHFQRAEEHLRFESSQLNKLRQQKLGLMQDLLTGKVPVKVAAAEMEPA